MPRASRNLLCAIELGLRSALVNKASRLCGKEDARPETKDSRNSVRVDASNSVRSMGLLSDLVWRFDELASIFFNLAKRIAESRYRNPSMVNPTKRKLLRLIDLRKFPYRNLTVSNYLSYSFIGLSAENLNTNNSPLLKSMPICFHATVSVRGIERNHLHKLPRIYKIFPITAMSEINSHLRNYKANMCCELVERARFNNC